MILALLRRPGSLRAARFFCAVAWCAAGAAGAAQPESASGFAPKPVATGARFMAVTANPHATAAAVEILELGGSATDAAIAAQLVLNLVEPQSSGIGGGGFLLHWDAGRRLIEAYDGRETAPASAHAGYFLDPDGRPLPFRSVVASGRAVGVPGLLAMLDMVHREHGRLRWERLFRPAIRLAESGFPVSARLNKLLGEDVYLRRNPAARALYYTAEGSPLREGDVLRNPEFATTLRRLAGADFAVFYRGEMARALVEAVAAVGGDLAVADLAAYRPRKREALCGTYRDWRICGMPPPSSGGTAVLQLLGIQERTGFERYPPQSAEAIHLFAEAGRLAFADRARYLGDPEFVAVPLREMLASAYLSARARLIRSDQSLGEALPGELAISAAQVGAEAAEAAEFPATTHLSIVDANGNAVAMTSSIEDAFGSRLMVGGYLLNNQLTDFAFASSRDGRLVANRVEAGKRPLSSMAPTLVFDRHGNLHAVLGSPGGARIINYVARTLTGLLDSNLSPAAVLSLPHAGSRNGPTEIESRTGYETLRAELERRGHRVTVTDMTSGLHLIVSSEKGWVGVADPRREGLAAGR